jgi:HPt (histidine-containing phosphotransfer) domain-containing protein
MSNDLYDLSILSEMVYDDTDFMRELVSTFIEHAPIDAAELQAFANEENWSDTSKKAHKLKSSIRTIGITSLMDLILEIEEDAKDEIKLDQISEKISRLMNTLELVLVALKNEPFISE